MLISLDLSFSNGCFLLTRSCHAYAGFDRFVHIKERSEIKHLVVKLRVRILQRLEEDISMCSATQSIVPAYLWSHLSSTADLGNATTTIDAHHPRPRFAVGAYQSVLVVLIDMFADVVFDLDGHSCSRLNPSALEALDAFVMYGGHLHIYPRFRAIP
jgi:hypothetical protein